MSPSSTTQAVARADLVRQAVQGDPWLFIPTHEPRVAALPPDQADELHVLVAHCASRLGLRTLALEHLQSLSPAARAQPGIAPALAAAQKLPADQIAQAARLQLCRNNVDAIAFRDWLPQDLAAGLDAWAAAIEDTQAFRTSTGVPVVRSKRAGSWVWTHFSDQKLLAQNLKPDRLKPGPHYLDCLHMPLVTRRLFDLTPRAQLGLESVLWLLVGDQTEFFDALSLIDLRDVLSNPRVRPIVGPDASATLERVLLADAGRALGTLISMPSPPPTPGRFTTEDLANVLQRVGRVQLDQQHEVTASLAATYADRDAAWWTHRYATASSSGRPLRAVIPTTRFSSFLKHSASDMADALRTLGWEATVCVEPDEFSSLNALGYARAIAAIEPDLILLLNSTRSQFYNILPQNVPVLTWIQDAMPHLFDEKVGAAMGPMDFLVGHPHPEFFQKFNYPAQRTIHAPVVASARKFNPEPAPRELLERHACEVAYVSHHAETPELFRDRVIREATGGPNAWIIPIVQSTFERVCGIAVRASSEGAVDLALRDLALGAARTSLGREPDSKQLALLHHAFARPLAERANRHQMVRWAAEICTRRGWRFNLYGRGWERVPAFAPFAKGELAHGEELRAAYQAASVHLHGGLAGYLHQRVMECALSGGLPLVRFNLDAFGVLEYHAAKRITLDGATPWICWVPDKSQWISATDHPDAAGITRLRQLFNLPVVAGTRHQPELLAPSMEFERAMVLPREAIWLLGDFAETTFDTPEALEARIEKAVKLPSWRTQLSHGIRDRVRSCLTYDAVLAGAISTIRRELAPAAAATQRREPVTPTMTPQEAA